MSNLCPVCLGSGLAIGLGGGPPFVPLWMSNRSGYSVKCAKCNGQGWLPDSRESGTNEDSELEKVYKILRQHSELNIDEISRLSGLSIPSAYQVVTTLRNRGLIGVTRGDPICYYALGSRSENSV